MYIPITKIVEERREVWGRLAEEVVDKKGEIMDYASSKPFFEDWTSWFNKATGGKSKGNLRAMHGKTAVGPIIALTMNDDEKSVDIGARVVDDQEWKKCLAGVYTGFSVGGDYVKRWQDKALDAVRYTANPYEASLADNPAMYGAVFSLVKVDGSEEARRFHDVTIDPLKKYSPDQEREAGRFAGGGGGGEIGRAHV